MKKVIVLLSKGYEETEALLVVTYLRRAEIFVDTVSVMDDILTYGDHCVPIRADKMWKDINLADYDAIVTPGGLIGSETLAADSRVTTAIADFYRQGKVVASICASPIVLNAAGIAGEIEGVCYPGCEEKVGYKKAHEDAVYVDRNVITSRGPLTAPLFALKLIEVLAGHDAAQEVADQILFPLVRQTMKDCTCFEK